MAIQTDSRHIAYCDIHCEDNVRFDEILKWQSCFDPNIIILNGDVPLAEYASHWNESVFAHMGYAQIGNKLQKEFDATHALIKRIRKASPNARIIWVPGNHERWYFWVAMFHPKTGVILGEAPKGLKFRHDLKAQADRMVSGIIRRHFKTEDLGVEVMEYNKPLHLGPLLYLHGHQFKSIASTKKFYPNQNLVIGHFHQKEIIPIHDSGRRGHAVQHFAVPTLMKLDRGYEDLKSSNHSNGFFYANISRTGRFEGFVKDVFGDQGHLFPWQV